jgi:hypothetical protein
MDGGEWAAVVTSVAVVILVGGLLVALMALARTLRTLREGVEDLRREAVPAVDEMRQTVHQARDELDRLDSLINTAETISQTVDAASRLAYLTFSNPAVKALSIGTGVGKAVRRLRGDDEPE